MWSYGNLKMIYLSHDYSMWSRILNWVIISHHTGLGLTAPYEILLRFVLHVSLMLQATDKCGSLGGRTAWAGAPPSSCSELSSSYSATRSPRRSTTKSVKSLPSAFRPCLMWCCNIRQAAPGMLFNSQLSEITKI